MVTRRTALGAGLAFASVACVVGFGAHGPAGRRTREERSTDALLVDGSIEMPRQLAAFIKSNRRTVPVVEIQLDAASQGGLMRILDKSQAIVGVSSGATLFCLERIARDHGYRLAARRQHHASDPAAACMGDVAALLGGAHILAGGPSPLDHAYRPTRADGALHVWAMQKSSPSLRQHRQAV